MNNNKGNTSSKANNVSKVNNAANNVSKANNSSKANNASNNASKSNNVSKVKLSKTDIKEKAELMMARINENKKMIAFTLIAICLLLLAYFFSKNYRVSKALYNMRGFKNYLYINSRLNTNEYMGLKFSDFYIACAFRPYLAVNQMLEYCSLEIMRTILKSGVRSVYIDVFNSNLGDNAEPIISSGLKQGQWKLTLNTLSFDDVCYLIASTVFSAGYVNNPEDPFILCLNLNTNGNIKCLNKMKQIIFKRFKRRLLDNSFTFSSKNMAEVPIKELFGKLVIFCSDGYQNSDLEELVNYSWDKPELRKMSYHALDPKISMTSSIKMNASDVLEYNKNNMTIVTPNEKTFFTYNYHAQYFLDTGCQLIMINYQKLDKHLDKYITFFKNESIIAKPRTMRGASYNEKIKMNLKKAVLEQEDELDTSAMSEKCPEKPSEDYLVGDDALFYKSNNSSDLGLCFMTQNDNANCNCDINVSNNANPKVSCNNTLWNQNSINNLAGNLCCSTRRINNPLPRKTPLDNDVYNNPSQKYYLSKVGTCTNSEPISVTLEDGVQNFNVTNNNVTAPAGQSNTLAQATLHKCPITSMTDLENTQVCLLDRNGNSNQKCPDGWKYNGKLDVNTYNSNINICCRNN